MLQVSQFQRPASAMTSVLNTIFQTKPKVAFMRRVYIHFLLILNETMYEGQSFHIFPLVSLAMASDQKCPLPRYWWVITGGWEGD